MSFSALPQTNSAVALQWSVAEQVNMSGYNVQRSSDGTRFEAIGHVPATSATQYSYADNNPLAGSNYYRLQMVSMDGTVQYSSVQQVAVNNNTAVKVSPNPFHNKIIVEVDSKTSGTAQLKLLSVAGNVVKTDKHYLKAGYNRLEVTNTNTLTDGQYILQVVDAEGNIIATKQLIKQQR